MTNIAKLSELVKIDNGVNVEALLAAREALEQAPEAAQFKWRASCEWINGAHSRSTIGSFYGLGTKTTGDAEAERDNRDHRRAQLPARHRPADR